MTLVADLRLRFAGVRLTALAYLPAPSTRGAGATPLVVWLAASETDDGLCHDLSAAAAAVVLEFGRAGGGGSCDYEAAALGWAAEHARDFEAHAGRLILGGQLAGGARAARLAIEARDGGWPHLRRQVLVRPEFSEPFGMPRHPAGAAPATIVTSGASGNDAGRYAAMLRAAGVGVQEVVWDVRHELPFHELAEALR